MKRRSGFSGCAVLATAILALTGVAGHGEARSRAAAADPPTPTLRLDRPVAIANPIVPVQHIGDRPERERPRSGFTGRVAPPAYGARPGDPQLHRPDTSPGMPHAGRPLPDTQIWGIVQRTAPGRIVNAQLRGPVYSFRIISNRGNIVDIEVDRHTGRLLSVRGGP